MAGSTTFSIDSSCLELFVRNSSTQRREVDAKHTPVGAGRHEFAELRIEICRSCEHSMELLLILRLNELRRDGKFGWAWMGPVKIGHSAGRAIKQTTSGWPLLRPKATDCLLRRSVVRRIPHGLKLPIIFDIDVPAALYLIKEVTGVRFGGQGEKETKSRQVARCLSADLRSTECLTDRAEKRYLP